MQWTIPKSETDKYVSFNRFGEKEPGVIWRDAGKIWPDLGLDNLKMVL